MIKINNLIRYTFYVSATVLTFFFLSSCNSASNDDLKAKELELKAKELELKEKELNGQGGGSGNLPAETPATVSFTPNGRITGNSVILRADHSTTAAKVTSMKKGQGVIILDEYAPEGNGGEAILTQKTDFYSDYNGVFVFSLPRGKAVMVSGRSDGYRYDISYQDSKTRSTGYAKISPDLLEFISGKTWYQVKLEDGKIGWVFGEFAERM
ncbi:MAG: hypothetical protein ACKO7P_04270 [Bacteroidota bacterium]